MRDTFRHRRISAILLAGLAPSLALAAPPAASGRHPLITEVLAAVPSGKAGDANADGTRDAIGDEFVELINPTDQPINLKGYTLFDSDAWNPGAAKPDPAAPANQPGPKSDKPKSDTGRAHLTFTFPDLTIRPGQVVVVFNGYKSTLTGSVGDADRAPSGPSDRFHNALVFSMKNESPYAALANESDFVLLVSPDGKPVQCIKWGKPQKNPPSDCPLIEEAPTCVGSAQRTSIGGKLACHRDLSGDFKGTNFSPGLFAPSAADTVAAPSRPDAGPARDKPVRGNPGPSSPRAPGR